jgi:hypothetical protein
MIDQRSFFSGFRRKSSSLPREYQLCSAGRGYSWQLIGCTYSPKEHGNTQWKTLVLKEHRISFSVYFKMCTTPPTIYTISPERSTLIRTVSRPPSRILILLHRRTTQSGPPQQQVKRSDKQLSEAVNVIPKVIIVSSDYIFCIQTMSVYVNCEPP